MIYCKKDDTSPTGFTITIEGDTSEVLQELAHVGAEIYNATLSGLGKVRMGIDETEEGFEDYELKPGNHFYYHDHEYVLLDITDSGDYFAVTANIVDDLQFNEKDGDGSNNWAASDLREWLNSGYMEDMEIDSEHIIKTRSDLTADNGDKSYGSCKDYITLLSCDQYREYREHVPRYDDCIWTLTPWSCTSGYAGSVRYVNPSGALNSDSATNSCGVAPACTFNHEILIPRRQAQTGRIILGEAIDSDG